VTTFEVLHRMGTAALIRFVGSLVLFLLLHLIRLPLVVAARVIEVCMRRVDAYATGQATAHPSRPRTQWFPREVNPHAHAV
jgi:hypothetical protein